MVIINSVLFSDCPQNVIRSQVLGAEPMSADVDTIVKQLGYNHRTDIVTSHVNIGKHKVDTLQIV